MNITLITLQFKTKQIGLFEGLKALRFDVV